MCSTVVRNLKEGLHFLFGQSLLRSLILVGAIYALSAGMWNTLLLPFATEALGASEFEYGLQEAATSIGFVIGSFFIARYADRLRSGVWIVLSLLGMGLFGIVYALSSSLTLAIAMVTITGFLNSWYYVARRTLIQRNTEREMRGRIFGAMMTIGHVVMLIGMGLAGAADIIGVREMMLIAVIVTPWPVSWPSLPRVSAVRRQNGCARSICCARPKKRRRWQPSAPPPSPITATCAAICLPWPFMDDDMRDRMIDRWRLWSKPSKGR